VTGPSRPDVTRRTDAADEAPPVLGRWGWLYALVLAGLIACILFCAWLAAHNR